MSTWRRLPAPVPPAQHETVASWLHRLAAVHGLHPRDLRAHLGIGRAVPEGGMPSLAGRLSAVTGYPAVNLARALPELRVPEPDWPSRRHLAQRACRRCTARHQGGPVRRLFAHHEYLCTRHGYWIGPPDPSRDDPPQPLAGQVPDLVAAQRTLDRTWRLHGWAAAFDAAVVATHICIDLRITTVHQPLWTRWERRLGLVMPGPYRRSLFMAAIFPEVAALAALLAAAPGADSLVSAARHALRYAEPPNRHDVSDALSIWARDREAGWRIRPVAAYSHADHDDDGSPRITEGRLTAEHQTATRFRRDRRAPFIPSPGLPMPYAHRSGLLTQATPDGQCR
ncbi:MAG: TniQ family protein [Streptosporangiaceae bacterium]